MATFRSGKDCLLSADGVRRHPPDEWWRKSGEILPDKGVSFKCSKLSYFDMLLLYMATISISTREDSNNRSMVQPSARLESGLTLRPISLGSLASPATALPSAKRLQKAKKPTCLGEALAETEACLPVTAYRREAGSPFC